MAYRKFWLQVGNSKYNLITDSFLQSPTGLGFNKTYSSVIIGSKEIISSESYSLPTISGNIVFFNGSIADKYEAYQQLLTFIRSGDVKLYYQPPNTFDTFYVEGIITKIEKGEVASNGVLTCPFSFKATTLWRNGQQRIIVTKNSQVEDKGKYYELERKYHYATQPFNDFVLINKGYENVGFELEITGEVTNPKLNLSQNDTQYGALQLLGTFDYIYINSRDGEEEIYLEYNGSALTNPIAYQDMSLADGTIDVTFLKLKTGTTHASFAPFNFDGEVDIKWYDSFMSV